MRETFSREVSIHVGGIQSREFAEIVSRELTVFVGDEPIPPLREAVSREMSVVVTTPAPPARIPALRVTASPTGQTIALSWATYNELAQRDVARYDIYLSTHAFTNVAGLTPYAWVPAGTLAVTLTNLPAGVDHFFAVVPVDALDGQDREVNYAAALVLGRELVSREFSIFVGAEPARPYREVVSREVSMVVTTPAPPAPVTNLLLTPSPAADVVSLAWTGYNELAQKDVARYEIYRASGPFSDVAGLTPLATVAAGTYSLVLSNLTAWEEHYFAVVAVDAGDQRDTRVTYAAVSPLGRELISREFSVFVGAEPDRPYREAVSREVSLVVSTPGVPEPVTGLGSGFTAIMSTKLPGAIDLAWPNYLELAQSDVVRYRVYVWSAFFDDLDGLKVYELPSAERTQWTITGLRPRGIYYVAVVAEDVLGQWNPVVRAASAQASDGPGIPEILRHPTALGVTAGAEATLSVAARSEAPLNYQWRLNGENIPGATNSTYSIPAVRLEDAGTYTVVVANATGAVESDPASLSVIGIPLLELVDNFADRRAFRDDTFTGLTNNLAATFETPDEPRHADKLGGKSMWLTWKPRVSGVASFSTAGSAFDTLLAVYTGNSLTTLQAVTSDDDRGGYLTSALQFNAVADTEYQVAIDGFAGASGELILSWELQPAAPPLPEITQSPEDVVAAENAPVSLVVAFPTPGATVQWLFNGLPLVGATQPTLSFTATPERVGSYRARVTSADGLAFLDSADALVEVVPSGFPEPQAGETASADKWQDLFDEDTAPAPPGRVLLKGRPALMGFTSVSLGLGGRYTDLRGLGQGGASTREAADPQECGAINGVSRWFRFRVPVSRSVEFKVEGGEVAVTLGVFQVVGATAKERALLQGTCAWGGGVHSPAQVVLRTRPGIDYLVVVAASGNDAGRVLLEWNGSEAMELEEPGIGFKDGRPLMEWIVVPGWYEVRSAETILDWQPRAQLEATNALLRYHDPEPVTQPARYYQLRLLPTPP